ncbi:uncharacterized protein LOC128738381 [Sabethes cyaneus]|uniref:uncharacterized protein LOC128738381 n=1 Tax=Sabethes cyaneus TaxID=53552 RepID=UPI00237ED5CA|nr:uncharacterized protein LOC128738381 [Sabethes cyaneus]
MRNSSDNVGILALEIVFPSQYVDQTELEVFDGVSAGKYTIGLGQSRMGFCSDREDVNSLCLTVVNNLLERHNVALSRIGRLEVGTETIVDKSKSVKSVLMQLFGPHGMTNLEGIDTKNACYGGTAALFNAIDWVESSSCKGRLALVVCADIAVYAQGSARPTGGAGAVAMLIGPNAPLVVERGLRATFMKHAYDFYKPDLSSEYPVVDGKLSIQCYLSALDNCYQLYRKQFAQINPSAKEINLDSFDAFIFHTPYCKLVQKSLARLGLNDFILTPTEQRANNYPGFEQFENVKLEETYFDREVEKAFMTYFTPVFNAKTKRSLHLANQVGNMYTPSVYGGLVSLLINSDVSELAGKKVGVFSYGSGLASTMYSIAVTSNQQDLSSLKDHLNYVQPLLNARRKVSPEQFTQLMEIREANNHAAPYEPSGSIEVLFPGTYYLSSVDKMHRRVYERVPVADNRTKQLNLFIEDNHVHEKVPAQSWPTDVGILALEVIFPSQFVDQTELEVYDGVSAGKYTIGLGQSRMGFCSDREDINSLCLTVANNLLERHQIPHARIGRLEVGTETLVDKSKSVKTMLMQLFEDNGVTNLEGIDTTNACYGGTAALFNAVNWVESSSCKGRLALVVCADIAVYAEGSARPTGGAGAIAMLVGPNAPLTIDRGLRATFMKHAYDFYKPDLSSEYPVVDGKLSIQCYLNALDNCYQLYRELHAEQNPNTSAINLNHFDAIIFHTPYCKLVQKSLARLGLNDFVLTPANQRTGVYPGFEQFADVKLEDTYFDREVEKAFMTHYTPVFNSKTKPSLHLANQVGNMYTPSVYGGLVSLLINSEVTELAGKKVGVFSYGSGLASSMYSISISRDAATVSAFKAHLSYVQPLLNARQKVAPEEFTRLMEVREKNNHAAPYEPSEPVDVLFPGTYYLKSVDKMHRRCYERTPPARTTTNHANCTS